MADFLRTLFDAHFPDEASIVFCRVDKPDSGTRWKRSKALIRKKVDKKANGGGDFGARVKFDYCRPSRRIVILFP